MKSGEKLATYPHVLSSGTLLLAKLLLVVVLFCPGQLVASGFVVYNQDPKADGMATAATASIDNPSAIFYNPGLLPDQPGFGISLNDTIVMSERRYTDSATGTRAHLKPGTNNVPSLFAKYTWDRWSVGIGVYNPFGLSNDWGKTWIGRYSATYSELNALFVTPTVAYKFNDSVSAGFGFSYVTSSVDLQNMLAFTPYPDGRAKLTGSGDGFGVNAGVSIKLPQEYTLAFTARSATKIKYDGEAKFYTPDDTIFKALYPALRNSDVSTTITLPWQLTGGIAKKIGALTLEMDVVYIGWSTIDHYRVQFDDGRPSAVYKKDWWDAFSFGAGANYRWSPSIETQLGYMYDMGCVPQRTMTPDLPDASKHILTAGIGYTAGPIKANLAYQATFFQRASSVNNIVNAPSGRYNQFLQMVLVSLSYSR